MRPGLSSLRYRGISVRARCRGTPPPPRWAAPRKGSPSMDSNCWRRERRCEDKSASVQSGQQGRTGESGTMCMAWFVVGAKQHLKGTCVQMEGRSRACNFAAHRHRMGSILILDFGSQYTQLIARRVRELNTFAEIKPWNGDWRACSRRAGGRPARPPLERRHSLRQSAQRARCQCACSGPRGFADSGPCWASALEPMVGPEWRGQVEASDSRVWSRL